MKKFFRTVRKYAWLALPLLVLVLCLAGLWGYGWYERGQFARAYSIYIEKATVEQNAAFVPGAAQNPLRGQLNQTLERLLAPGTTAKDRLDLAHQGLDLVIESNAQVDAIGLTAPDVDAAANDLEKAANNPGNILKKAGMMAIVAIARQQLYTIEDIRGLSYRANFETAEVFNRLITDDGALTASYTKDLNDLLPEAEANFNKKQNAYADLEKQMYDIEQAYGTL